MGKQHNFYVLYGLDKLIIEKELAKLIEKWKLDDTVTYDMTTNYLEDVIEDASTVSMFHPSKGIILENCNFLCANKTIEKLELLEKYLEHPNPNNYCFFIVYAEKIDTRKKIYKLLKEQGQIIEFKTNDEGYATKFIEEYLAKNGYKIESIPYFLKKVGYSLANIQNELDKLIMYKLETKRIDNIDIDKITIPSTEEEIFALTDAIIAKNIQKSLTLLEEFLNKNYEEIQLIMLLASQFRFYFQVKRLLNKGKSENEIAKILEVNPYRVKFSVKKLYSYTEGMLLEYIQKLAKMDHDIKLGLMDKKLALELFIINNKE